MPSETAENGTSRTKNTAILPHAPPKIPDPLPCPRCESLNTKFCYYNNYNLSQPHHFCKSCRRYWTHGGALRNVPVGGGTRKNSKRCRSSSSNLNSTPTTTITKTKVFTPIPELGPELMASNVKPDFPALKCENSRDNLNPIESQRENFISAPSVAEQEPGFMFGYGSNSNIGFGFGYGVLGFGESGDGGEMFDGDRVAWPSIVISMPPKV